MYINPFLAGVICTIGVELGIIITAAFIEAIKRVRRHDNFR
jgi:hypothetical protein